jgi:hypothetical protein
MLFKVTDNEGEREKPPNPSAAPQDEEVCSTISIAFNTEIYLNFLGKRATHFSTTTSAEAIHCLFHHYQTTHGRREGETSCAFSSHVN